jgi:hypothetical protein
MSNALRERQFLLITLRVVGLNYFNLGKAGKGGGVAVAGAIDV